MCDTFLALGRATEDSAVIFGKNSDREPNEAQVLEYQPAQFFSAPQSVQCTYRTIPQVKETYAVILCRPFWMWGAEMGANEKGVVIGNEAVFTRMPVVKSGGLTGMDLLRLALERSATAPQALETITGLLSDHGQGGVCGYEDKRFAYHNSFIIADPREGWVLETAGPLWAAIKIKDFYSISNALTIGEEFDESHPTIIDTARKKGWLKSGETFHFARCYSDWFYTTFSASGRRRNRSLELIRNMKGKINTAAAIQILRDHHETEYRPDSHFLGTRICAHAANKLARNASQTTGSLVAHLAPQTQTYWATGTAAPCTSVFKPFWFEGKVLPRFGIEPGNRFDPNSLWWHHEQLHRGMLLNYPDWIKRYSPERDELENSLMQDAAHISSGSRAEFTQHAFIRVMDFTNQWIKNLKYHPAVNRTKWLYRQYWQKQNRKAGIFIE
ncbi:MAG: C69 family dipeptidase [Desulfobacterales bacterium]|jgi:dipeptidase